MTTNEELHARIGDRNLATRFLETLGRNPGTTVLRWKETDGTWRTSTIEELADVTARLVTGLQDLGVGHGDRVVLMIRNRPEFHPIDIAVLFCGATPISIYNSSAPDQIEYVVNDCGAKVAIVEDADFLSKFLKVAESTPSIE